MVEVRIGEEAEAEYTEALAWYASRSTRAADGFEAAFAIAIEQIRRSPERFPECDEAGYRFAVLGRYPYNVVYRVSAEVALVVAVATRAGDRATGPGAFSSRPRRQPPALEFQRSNAVAHLTDRITIEPGKRGGRPCIRGMRITVYDVLSYLVAGMTVAEVLDDFPYLTLEDIQACFAFADQEVIS